MWSYIYCNCSRYDQIALKSKDWILYTKLSNIKKYIKLHFPNKYWSIFVSMPSTSSWDTFRTTDILIHHRYLFSIHEYSLFSLLLTHPLIFSPSLWRQNNFFMLHLLQPSTYEIIPYHMTCSVICAKTYIVNRFLSLHQCSIIQDMRPCFRCKHTTRLTNVTARYAASTNCSCYRIYCNWPECTSVPWSDYLCESYVCALLRWQNLK